MPGSPRQSLPGRVRVQKPEPGHKGTSRSWSAVPPAGQSASQKSATEHHNHHQHCDVSSITSVSHLSSEEKPCPLTVSAANRSRSAPRKASAAKSPPETATLLRGRDRARFPGCLGVARGRRFFDPLAAEPGDEQIELAAAEQVLPWLVLVPTEGRHAVVLIARVESLVLRVGNHGGQPPARAVARQIGARAQFAVRSEAMAIGAAELPRDQGAAGCNARAIATIGGGLARQLGFGREGPGDEI